MNTNSIGGFLAALRKTSGMTQKQLAEKLNVSDKAVSRWERDECAPDLSLIPVLAEIYGVTCDEILRGQRANPDAAPTPQAEEKSKKRLQYMLNQAETTYRIRSMISCTVAGAGLIGAMICNLAFNRAYLGFLIGTLFFLGAGVCQTIFSIQSRSSLQNEDFEGDALEQTRRSIGLQTNRVYSLILVLFAATLPLMMVEDAYWGLSAVSWLSLGVIFGGVALILCALVCHILSVRRGYRAAVNWKAPLNRLRLRTAGILLLVLVVTGVLQLGCAFYLSANPHLYSESDRFDDWESFTAYIEQPLSDYGEKLTFLYSSSELGEPTSVFTDESGYEYCYPDREQSVYGRDGTLLCSYQYRNYAVQRISYSSTDDRLPVYTQTRDQYFQASRRFNLLMAIWIPLYLVEVAVAFRIYRKKKRGIK